jgi:Fur family transcriptional regulator, peroxide stress response regulator
MNTSEDRFQEIVTALQSAGYRLTPQRLALVRLMVESDQHPSASQLYAELQKQFPTTSLATVYKTLHVLSDLGEVQEMHLGQDEHRYDGSSAASHPHLICVQCQQVIDVPVRLSGNLAEEVAQASGYRILSHRVEFYGLCPKCQEDA